MKCPDIITIDQ